MKYKKYIKYGLPVIAGASLGYLYYFFIGCNSGSCAITSSPYISTLYGALVGAFLIPSKKTKTDKETG